jgi:C4-dicarboxylate transporter, DctM subunit
LIWLQAKREGIPREGQFSWKRLGAAFMDALIALGMPAIIFGGILGGVFTATEAAAVAVLYGLVVGLFVYKEIKPRQLIGILAHSALLTAAVGFLVGAAGIFAFILASERVPHAVAQGILAISRDPTFFMLVSLVVFLSVGLILEGLPAVIVLFPILQPVARQVGIDPLHYAIVATAAIGIGIFIPPLGVGYLIACGIGRVRASDAIRPMLPYVAVLVLGLLLVALVPSITLIVPRLLGLY